ncbi:MAG: Cof-type HAD-IIB family hydrolase [Acidimicrobiales bacterium]|nr:Cof-type HAD-IIB family hydrolase [Acidimicrobiales bacterium]
MSIRLIATDLDGTLFGSDHRPAARSVAAINAASDAGIHVCAATGRSWFYGLDMATSTGARLHHFIGSNGGHRVDAVSRSVEERIVFAPDTIEAMVAAARRGLGDVGFGFELADEMVWDERFVELSPVNLDGRPRSVKPTPEHRRDEIGKMFIAHPDIGRVDLVEAVEPFMPDEVNITTSGVEFIEVTPPGADKGSAVERLATSLGFTADEVLAFGDNQNDLSLLRWAGRGVAMGNALDMVKAVADEETTTNVEHGVALVIEQLLA